MRRICILWPQCGPVSVDFRALSAICAPAYTAIRGEIAAGIHLGRVLPAHRGSHCFDGATQRVNPQVNALKSSPPPHLVCQSALANFQFVGVSLVRICISAHARLKQSAVQSGANSNLFETRWWRSFADGGIMPIREKRESETTRDFADVVREYSFNWTLH